MKYKYELHMKATVHKEVKKEGLEIDEKQFEDIKKGETKAVDKEHIYGVEENGTRYVKLITGFYYFVEESKM